MKFSTKTQYALRALITIAQSEKKFISSKEIAQKEHLPLDYLEKIITKLQKKGIVKSKKGKNGGYALPCSPKKIKIKKVIEALEGSWTPVKCLEKKFTCEKEKNCLAKNFWKEFKKSIDRTLNKITLEDLIK